MKRFSCISVITASVCTAVILSVVNVSKSYSRGAGQELPEPELRFSLIQTGGEKALDITTEAEGKDLQLYPFHGRIGQRFYLLKTDISGQYRIVAEISGLSLAAGKENMVIAAKYMPKKSFRWRFIAAPDGGTTVINVENGYAISCVDSWRGMLEEADGRPGQSFRFQPIITEACQPPRDRKELADIPIIDVHNHIQGFEKNEHNIAIGKILESRYNILIDIWIDLDGNFSSGWNENYIEESRSRFGERIQYVMYTGYTDILIFKPDDVSRWAEKGALGYKMWWGYAGGIDAPENDPTYTRLEELGIPVASAHIAHPFFSDEYPEEKWTEAMDRWENVLKKHPRLVAVMAHMGCMMISEKTVKRLERMLKKYPNLYIDTCYGFTPYCLADYNWIRNFMIKYADRILFGTDLMTRDIGKEQRAEMAAKYDRVLRFFETDEYFTGSTFLMGGNWWVYRGLNLPRDVIEKIYYKNALRIYPGLKVKLETVRGKKY